MKKTFCLMLVVLMCCMLTIPAMAASEEPVITLQPQSPNYPEYSVAIYTVKAEEDDSVVVEKALGSVTIDRSYTSAGVAILKDDDSSIAQYITIPVHKDAVGTFYQALEDRRIEIVKHP